MKKEPLRADIAEWSVVKLSDYRREGSAPRPGQVSLSNRSTTASMSLEAEILRITHCRAEILSCTRCQAEFTDMKFESSDSLDTGCTVTMTGTGLLVGESLNVTLNSSHSFIAAVTSETEVQSAELQVG
ncbi:hypothetical protein BLNAU_3169 [Blattamonas nauphoetae]|uniref:Uncharacterized protein n=1 Tax=Blattamonas nauphoetae TaxID=2049346 RepID=A0ABQ9X4S0_9EUKA|nr:hypothetical protein BLNAU_18846 [Blattamonas nauphoetae]KAK2946680.1 hypothetical protein BLNAU_18432 [Blattamonas nauphoetae]KAK2951802.1 hypothetical protein BLNAU_13295 [Blattamonas nauphoetae]KAK2953908.1 hypothetical protein BLNAU_11168 [Blattamonas nauphoetae]KAK2954934.1 hypothetical protein BLNAU_10074 [Blattamonas nauphoetae]